MFKKYEKTYRIIVPDFTINGKNYLDREETKHLLNGFLTIEEKLDGGNTAFIRHKTGFSLQKRGSLVGYSEHEQYRYFHNWANTIKYNNIMEVPKGHYVYGELMYCKHTVYYDKLPDYFLVFDILTPKGQWMDRDGKGEFCEKYGFSQVPLVKQGTFKVVDLYKLIPKVSAYGSEPAEGIVIKKYNKNGYWRAKLVRPEFVKRLEEDNEHWTRRKIVTNKLKE